MSSKNNNRNDHVQNLRYIVPDDDKRLVHLTNNYSREQRSARALCDNELQITDNTWSLKVPSDEIEKLSVEGIEKNPIMYPLGLPICRGCVQTIDIIKYSRNEE
jgi:hypothetical protein